MPHRDDNLNTLRDKTPRVLDFAEALKPSRCKAPCATHTITDATATITLKCDANELTSPDQDSTTNPDCSPSPTTPKSETKNNLGSETTMSSPETCSAMGCPPSFLSSTNFQFDQDPPDADSGTSPSPQPPQPDQQQPAEASAPGCSLHINTTSPESAPIPPEPEPPTCCTPAPQTPPSELQSQGSGAAGRGSFSFEGPRVAPDPDPQLARQLLRLQSPSVSPRRFHAADITCNFRLQEAARKELRHRPWELGPLRELGHMQAALEATDADAAEESRVNCEVAGLVLQRLEDGRRSLHKLVRLLQGLVVAESAYMTAMQSVSHFLASDDYVPFPQPQQGAGAGAGGLGRSSVSGGGASPYPFGTPTPSARSSMAGGPPGGGVCAYDGRPSWSGVAASYASQAAPAGLGIGGNDGDGQQLALTWALSSPEPLPPLVLPLPSVRSAPSDLSRCTSVSSQGGLAQGGLAPASPTDSPTPVECLVSSFCHLPELIAQSHGSLHSSLSSLAADCQRLEEGIVEACVTAAPEAAAAAAGVAAARGELAAAFARHAAACRSFDQLLLAGDVKGRLAAEQDPWATEGGVARAHRALQAAQGAERASLQRAFHRAQSLERARLELSKQAVAAAAGSYRAALLPVQHDLVALTDGAAATDTAAQLGKLAAAAAAGADIAAQLTAQQAAYMGEIRRCLFSSPEIVLQGPLQLLDSPVSQWKSAHFVLTCAGFLHWFRSKEQGLDEPLGSLGLAQCSFEPGTAHTFHVLEARRPAGAAGWLLGAGRPHRFSFQAEREECCSMWVAGVKQAIMLASGKV